MDLVVADHAAQVGPVALTTKNVALFVDADQVEVPMTDLVANAAQVVPEGLAAPAMIMAPRDTASPPSLVTCCRHSFATRSP